MERRRVREEGCNVVEGWRGGTEREEWGGGGGTEGKGGQGARCQ